MKKKKKSLPKYPGGGEVNPFNSTDSLYYGSPYKDGQVLDIETFNKNKNLELLKQKELVRKVKMGVDLAQTTGSTTELFPLSAPLGFTINAAATIPSLALNYKNKNKLGITTDLMGLIPEGKLYSKIDAYKTTVELGYNGYNLLKDFKLFKNGGKVSKWSIID